MTALEQLQETIHGIQALRRFAERLASPWQGATGVAAQFYPHQLQTVLRILRDTQVRHLIADEVGLGKSVQALMVFNALRLQRGLKLRAIVVTPQEQQARQWSDEIWGRAHTAASIDEEPLDPQDWVRILWPARISRVTQQLDPSGCDLLILDEIQSLPDYLLNPIARRADEFQHLLILTATPNLRSTKAVCRLLQLIEPDRVEWGRRQALHEQLDDSDESEESASVSRIPVTDLPEPQQDQILGRLAILHQRALEGDLPVPSLDLAGLNDHQRRRLMTKAWWLYRRVIRSRRDDYPQYLPQRRSEARTVEPLSAEEERLRRMHDYLLERGGDSEGAALIARRAALGGESLRDRIGEIQRQDRDPTGELETVKALCRPECGDSRLDELTDWLAEFWRDDPTRKVLRKVLVAAQDNPTIRFLERELQRRLPEVGPRHKRQPLQLVTLLFQQDRPDYDLVDAYHRAQEAIKPFEGGQAQLAIAHDIYREAYNFQAVDAIVFYSIPWTPEHVDQWIGRVDRLGREPVDPDRTWTPLPVRVVCLAQRGQLDERIVEIYDTCRVFERAMQLDRMTVGRIAAEIQQAGLTGQPADLDRLEADLTQRTDDSDAPVEEHAGVFGLPGDAANLYERLRCQRPMEPVARRCKALGYVSSPIEKALAQWLRLLREHGYYNFFSNSDADDPEDRKRRYYTLSHRSPDAATLTGVEQLSPPKWAPYFIPRKHVQRPPRTFVDLQPGEHERVKRALQFLDHGSRLHEDLVGTWRGIGGRGERFRSFRLHLAADHLPAGSAVSAGRYIIAVGSADPAAPFDQCDWERDLIGDLPAAPNPTHAKMRERELARLRVNLEADMRFIRSYLPAQLPIVGRVASGSGWTSCDNPQVLYDLLTLVWSKNDAPPCQSGPISSPDQVATALNTMTQRLAETVKGNWANLISELRAAITERLLLVQVETEDRVENLRAALGDVEERIREFEQWPSERNDQVIRMTLRPRESLLRGQICLTGRRLAIRTRCLRAVLDNATSPSVELYACLELRLETIAPSPPPGQVNGCH